MSQNIYGQYIDVNQIESVASNVRLGTNPAYTITEFLAQYPQFGGATPNVPVSIVNLYINFAHSVITQLRYKDSWELCMGLFIAHYCTLYLQSASTATMPTSLIASKGQTQGVFTGKTLDGASYSVDANAILSDLAGFAGFKATHFGVQFATLARFANAGGMVIR